MVMKCIYYGNIKIIKQLSSILDFFLKKKTLISISIIYTLLLMMKVKIN